MRSLGVLVATRLGPAVSIVALACLPLSGCTGSTASPRDASTPLRFGLFIADATGSEQELAERYRPVADYLRDSLPRPIDLTVGADAVGSSRVDLQACKLEYSIVSPK